MPGLMEMLFGSGDKFRQISTQNPQQQQFLNQLFQQLGGMGGQGGAYGNAQNYLSNLLSGDPNAFAQFEAPYRQQFETQTIPGIAERFAGTGAQGGALSSSGFGQALGGAGAQLQSQLAGLHGNLRNQAVAQAFNQYNNLANLGLGQRTFENVYQPGSSGFLGELLSGLGGGLGEGLGMKGAGALSRGGGALFQKLMSLLR